MPCRVITISPQGALSRDTLGSPSKVLARLPWHMVARRVAKFRLRGGVWTAEGADTPDVLLLAYSLCAVGCPRVPSSLLRVAPACGHTRRTVCPRIVAPTRFSRTRLPSLASQARLHILPRSFLTVISQVLLGLQCCGDKPSVRASRCPPRVHLK